MDDSDDAIRNLALGVVAGAVLLAVGIVLAVAVGIRADRGAAVAAAAIGAETIRFEPGAFALSAEAADRLVHIAEALRSQQAEAVFVTPVFSDAAAAPLALRRALAVRHALESNGVPSAAVVVNAPRPGQAPADTVELRMP